MYCVQISTGEVLRLGVFEADQNSAEQFGTATSAARAIRACADVRADRATIRPISFQTVAVIGDLI